MLETVESHRKTLEELKASFDLEGKQAELSALDKKLEDPDIWNDPKAAGQLQKNRSGLKTLVDRFAKLEEWLADVEEFAPMVDEDPDLVEGLEKRLKDVQGALSDLEFRRILGGEMDASNAILSINSGAGGTEAQDWVSMLMRMYMRWAEEKGFKVEVMDSLPGEEAGFKNVTLGIAGDYAYGNLRAEMGIHRLVRISPFDSNSRRHTSFASVMVLPELDDDVELDLDESDVRVDTFRASGAGGQHVNKTDSAIRLTHEPSGIVVSCQNERSQHKNKAQAYKILRARLYEVQRQERDKEREKLEGDKKGIDFGSQIRSYVMQPYQLVKDHRTNHETGNVIAVMDGAIDAFIRAYLLQSSA